MMLNPKTIGEKIGDVRKKMNMSQAELASKLAISPQAVGKWERGESLPDIITFDRMAAIMAVDVNYFLGKTETPNLRDSAEKIDEKSRAWDMSQGNWVNADFSGLKNLKEKFSSSNLQNCKFVGSDLAGLVLKNNNISGCDFSKSDFSGSQLQSSNFEKNIFSESLLINVVFEKSFIANCDFSGADLKGIEIKNGGFEKNKIENAVLSRASFVKSWIAEITFKGPVEDCYFENCTFKKVIFQNAVLLNTFFKNNKYLNKVKFVDCKADRMTYEFLKSGKADLSGITLQE